MFLKKEIDLQCIFERTESKRKVILIEGAPGAGKTMLIWHICQEWGENLLFTQFQIIALGTLCNPPIQRAKSITDVLSLTCENQSDIRKVSLRMKNVVEEVFCFYLMDGMNFQKNISFLFPELI